MAKAEPCSITRRSLVAALALPVIPALPVASELAAPALPAAAPPPDPIFAAIEAHTRAFRAFTAVLDALAVAETEAWHAPRGARRAAKQRLKQARADESHFGNLESDAFAGLVATVPQTLAARPRCWPMWASGWRKAIPSTTRMKPSRCSPRSNARFAGRRDCRHRLRFKQRRVG